MDPAIEWIVSLTTPTALEEQRLGGKAAKLAQLAQAGFRVPDGFCITTPAYEYFLREADLARLIRMELGRKPFESMRWEELWDAALRIRSAFLTAPIPPALTDCITTAVEGLGTSRALAVRSSAPGEDSANRSFAGLHESVVGVIGVEAVLDAVKVVWASLWSDAALLYRQELSLDPGRSRMAVVVQEMVDEDRSGVAFGRDPRQPQLDRAVVEAVPGPCADLVDGLVDPDRWILARSTGDLLEFRPGIRGEQDDGAPILDSKDLSRLHRMLLKVESLFHWPPDTEWTGRQERFTLLQARPITTTAQDSEDVRDWYLSLRPSWRRLTALGERVAGQLIPLLEAVGDRFAAESIEGYSDLELAAAINERQAALEEWRQTYLDEFIPFAHGVRQLGIYYNDAVQPDDAYEFVGLLQGERMVASQRNEALRGLAEQLRRNEALGDTLEQALAQGPDGWRRALREIKAIPGGAEFLRSFEDLRTSHMDVAYDNERLADRPDLVLATVLEMAGAVEQPQQRAPDVRMLEERLLQAVGPARQEEARQVLAIGRLSWRLRDDDNVLVGRLESQLLRAVGAGADRLRASGRLAESAKVGLAAAPEIEEALRNPQAPVTLPLEPEAGEMTGSGANGGSPRQLVGQPAAPGLATGRVRVVQSTEDLGRFRQGEVLVCDAIQPTMTHLVPLAAAVVERRGGMLIHGSIIARELGIPCVNGIARVSELVHDGEVVTVDGYLGIVTVGRPEFDLEIANEVRVTEETM